MQAKSSAAIASRSQNYLKRNRSSSTPKRLTKVLSTIYKKRQAHKSLANRRGIRNSQQSQSHLCLQLTTKRSKIHTKYRRRINFKAQAKNRETNDKYLCNPRMNHKSANPHHRQKGDHTTDDRGEPNLLTSTKI